MNAMGQIQGAARGGYQDMQAKEARQLEVPHQFEKLERTLSGCGELVAKLSDRLEQSVMRSEPPSPSSTGTATPIQGTKVGSNLQQLTNAAAEITARLQSMLQRLEV